jgi:hypothetical protein
VSVHPDRAAALRLSPSPSPAASGSRSGRVPGRGSSAPPAPPPAPPGSSSECQEPAWSGLLGMEGWLAPLPARRSGTATRVRAVLSRDRVTRGRAGPRVSRTHPPNGGCLFPARTIHPIHSWPAPSWRGPSSFRAVSAGPGRGRPALGTGRGPLRPRRRRRCPRTVRIPPVEAIGKKACPPSARLGALGGETSG